MKHLVVAFLSLWLTTTVIVGALSIAQEEFTEVHGAWVDEGD